ncbi:MAG: HAD-IA family hydrolase [Alphaproteobacteria bacterium]
MDNKPLVCAVFDVDGTLVNSASIVIEAITKMCKQNNLPVPSDKKIISGIGLSLEDAIGKLFPEEKANISKLADDYRVFANDIRENYIAPMYEGALDFLDFLENKDILLAIATGNSRKGVETALRSFNILSRFISIKTADTCKGKPDSDMLDQVARETGVDRSNIIMIGDSIYDMQMAKNAKTKSVGASWGYHDANALLNAGASIIADSYEDLKNKFDVLVEK